MNVTRMSKRRFAAALAALLLGVLAAVPESGAQTAAVSPPARERKEIRKGSVTRAKAQPRSVSGQQVFVDPVTGELRAPTAVESLLLASTLDESLSQSSEGLVVVELEDGTLMVDLQDRFQEVALASIVDGRLTFACHDEARAIRALLTGLAAAGGVLPQSAPQALEEK